MIVSRKHGFVFVHNPKVGGSSVRSVLEALRDPDVDLSNVETDPAARLYGRDRAHIGLAEFIRYFPELWSESKNLPFFVLYREPFGRFLSSVNEFSRVYGATDIRFVSLPERRKAFLDIVERLERLGTAESVMDDVELTHFRPQWIYLLPPDGVAIDLHAFELKDMAQFAARLSECVGEPLEFGRKNSSEQFELPAMMQQVLGRNAVKKRLRQIPGARWAMEWLRGRNLRDSGAGTRLSVGERYGLGEAEQRDVADFVDRFYARDLAVLAGLASREMANEA